MALPPPLPGGYQLWYYYPSVPGSVVISIIFAILSAFQLYGIILTRKRFCIPLVVGGVFEIIGYIFRVVAHFNTTKILPYTIQSLLILLAPILFAASVYMYLGRIITGVQGERYSMIRQRWLTKIFVAGDVFCFFIQAGGGGLLATAKNSSSTNLGGHVILGGLILQIIIFVFFVIVALTFHIRLVVARAQQSSRPWQKLLTSLYAISFLITLRNVVRAIEYATSSSGYLLRREWVIFAFDGACMILVLLISLSWYGSDVDYKLESIAMDTETFRIVNRK